jgi:H+-transporting ATPase
MLTGDAVAIGKELARQLHLGTNIYDSEKLIGSSMTGSDVSISLARIIVKFV